MDFNIAPISWEAFEALEAAPLRWPWPFVRPFWLRSVARHLGAAGEPLILAARNGDALAGLAPLAVSGDTAYFLGNPQVCDYLDLVALPGRAAELLAALEIHLYERGIRRLVLQSLHPESMVLRALDAADAGRRDTALIPDGESYEALLPSNWEAYLLQLGGKQRHEVRRKLRRLESAGSFEFRLAHAEGSALPGIDIFLDLFGRNRADKAAFMTPAMQACFRELAAELAARRMLRLYLLEVHGRPAAAAFCFDDQGVRYLYNSAYDENFEELSVGVLCKLLSIRAAIETGCRRYDFLKGAKAYKKRIGGAPVPLVRCDLKLG